MDEPEENDRITLERSLQEAQKWELTCREEFARQLLDAAEKERQALAAELHDSLGQDLSLITNRVHQALAQPGLPSVAVEHLNAISSAASSAISELRNLVRNLRPLQIEQQGFSDSIRELVERMTLSASLHVDLRIENVDDEIKGQSAMHLYRIVQEALSNLVKHSGADHARFGLERDIKCIRLRLWDNGRGFDANQAARREGLGLTSIAERTRMLGGTANIQSTPGAGTRLTIEMPFRDAI
jgi:signal transduction histidine kinase